MQPANREWYQKTKQLLRAWQLTEEQERKWFNTPHADLSGQTPAALLQAGKGEIVCDMLAAALDGLPT